MSCYKPLMAVRDPLELSVNGKPVIRFLKGLDLDSKVNTDLIQSGELLSIPCGKCVGCRLDHARHWADRMVLELDRMKKCCFVTLTYDPEFLPPTEVTPLGEAVYLPNAVGAPISPLVKDHMPEFMKRLREDLNRETNVVVRFTQYPELFNEKKLSGSWLGLPQVKVRFYGCGEYGEERGRPHMHIILFGISLADLSFLQSSPLRELKKNELGQITYRSEYLTSLWQKGNVDVSEASYHAMGYVARYTMKKVNGNPYPALYGLPDEFVLMSRRPGIGAYFLEDHPGKVDEVSSWYVDGKAIFWPKYLIRKEHEIKNHIEVLDPQDPKHYYKGDLDPIGEKYKSERQQLCINNFVNTFVLDERPYYEKRLFLERQKQSSVKKLSRGDVALD